jgi:diguanylate cyclase (GGDEF)-like protein
MTVRAPQHTPAELRSLEARKRGVYSVAALAGVLVTMLSWFTRDPDDIVIEVVYPVLAVMLLAFLLALHRRRASLHTLERIILAVLTVVIMGRLAWHLLWGGHIDEHLLVLAGGHYWAVAVLLIAGFVLLGRRSGLWFGIGVLVTSVLLVALGAGPELLGPEASDKALLYLVRLHGFLVMVLVLVLAVATLRDQLHQALSQAETFEQLAAIDPLTGLANRRAAIDVLTRELQEAERYGTTVSVVALDVDHFKAINDAHGHQVGDAVLADIGALLAAQAREIDHVIRWGGEEFLVIAPKTDRVAAIRMAERFRRVLATARPGGQEITATFGVAQHERGDDLDRLLLRADQLLYEAKEAGRNQVLGQHLDAATGISPDVSTAP